MDMGDSSEKRPRAIVKRGKGIGVLTILALLMVWFSGKFMNQVRPVPPQPEPEAPKYAVHRVSRHLFPLSVEQAGAVSLHAEESVTSRISAQIKEIMVGEGDVVRGLDREDGKPTMLAILDDSEIETRLSRAEFQVEEAERAVEIARARLVATKAQVRTATSRKEKLSSDYLHYLELQRSQAATPQQVEQARNQRGIVEAQLKVLLQEVRTADEEIARANTLKLQARALAAEAGTALDDTAIYSPFSGRVVRKVVNVGDMAQPGKPLFYVETTSRPEFHATVPEPLMPYLKVGQDLEVRIDAPDRAVTGKVKEIEPLTDSAVRSFKVRVSLQPDPAFVDGLPGRLQIPKGEHGTLVVPSRALREEGQLHVVDVLGSDGRAERRFVTLGQFRDGSVEVLSGLKENEEVILHK